MAQVEADGQPKTVPQGGFLDDLARGTPTPGGGSASAFSTAASAALVAMVARLTVGKKKYADVETKMWSIIERADALRQELTTAIEEDASAFQQYLTAVRLPKDTDDQQVERDRAIQQATQTTIQVPLRVAEKAVEVLGLGIQVASSGNLNAISDAGSAAALAQAGLTGAGLNVRINCQNLIDQSSAAAYLSQISALDTQANLLANELKRILIDRGNLNL